MATHYTELMSGTEALVTTLGIFSANKGVIPAFTPLMQEDATGALVVWDGTSAGKAVYVSAVQIDTAKKTQAQVYKTGVLNVDLRVRIRLLTAQAEAQELKNERDRGDVIDTEFCMYALSKLASQISSIMDSLPLTMQRSFPQMTPVMLDGLKKEVVRACNACTKLDENIPRMLSDYLMETTGNVPDKFQPDKDK
ncbi:terminase small subunit [Escherichia coli]|uniref:terminase small subunit n=2 Tax=Escherichia coli TaxID=562 RepID=UPI001FCE359C|nr:terminase small subunit [Escherichia coli]